jgi:hypothetical protein
VRHPSSRHDPFRLLLIACLPDLLQDDASALHVPSCKRWDLIWKVWAAEYLGLVPDAPAAVAQARGEDRITGLDQGRPTPTTASRKVERSGDL